jgi:hypothetical protein
MQKIKLDPAAKGSSGPTVQANCPHCGHFGTFEVLPHVNDLVSGHFFLGQRKCPDPKCRGHIFYVFDNSNKNLKFDIVPAETIPFNRENIPANIVRSFEEALNCYANNCHIAAAIMIRKTIELICEHRGATGDNLKKKISNLGTKIIIPSELLGGLDELRLLGNDAAHIEAQVFESIGDEEIKVSIEVATEILKAVYQYQSLIDKLRALKKPLTSTGLV